MEESRSYLENLISLNVALSLDAHVKQRGGGGKHSTHNTLFSGNYFGALSVLSFPIPRNSLHTSALSFSATINSVLTNQFNNLTV